MKSNDSGLEQSPMVRERLEGINQNSHLFFLMYKYQKYPDRLKAINDKTITTTESSDI